MDIRVCTLLWIASHVALALNLSLSHSLRHQLNPLLSVPHTEAPAKPSLCVPHTDPATGAAAACA
jgi:hypothetical protein